MRRESKNRSSSEGKPVSAAALKRISGEILEAAGLSKDDSKLVADTLVQADLWGHQSHGVLRLSSYVARLRSGAVNASAIPAVVRDRGTAVLVDGHGAMGQVVANMAMNLAIDRAQKLAIGAVSVRNSNHFGTAMYFTLLGARRGCIAFLTTNASPAMPPWGGRTKAVGTNPWSWAAPAGKHSPMVLDIANTAVARGKIHVARERGEAIPEGWALDENGASTTDPVAALAGVTLPMGGHKGYGISLMMDILAGVLSGSAFGSAVAGPFQSKEPGNVGHFALAVNIDAFMPLSEFEERQNELIASLKQNSVTQGFEEILYPGEREAGLAARAEIAGINLPCATCDTLTRLCDEFGIAMPNSW